MSDSHPSQTIDMIRWTFSVNPEHHQQIETHLSDLGFDVHAVADSTLVATWEEPEGNMDEIIEELWALNGEPFEITHEEFHRLNLAVYNHADDADEPQRAVA